ncbi:MAG: hypothetical protein ABI556_10745 [Gemmatimonadales bacterium]
MKRFPHRRAPAALSSNFLRALLIGVSLFAARSVTAQQMPAGHVHGADSVAPRAALSVGASAILEASVAIPGVHDRTLAEGYITQPMVMAQLSALQSRFIADLTLNFEGITLDRGELNAGMYGEGYVDRRHPHTLLHEIAATGMFGSGLSRFSVSAGKGFVPFGTDDPMSRPFVKYPVNHHLAQLLERAFVGASFRSGHVGLEVASFNGDEPQSAYDMPNWDRFADSWSARVTGYQGGLEVQGSVAHVESPEQPRGGGLDHRKLSGSVRYQSGNGYGLVEFAKTKELDGATTAFTFNSALAEGSFTRNAVTFALRAERTERPEEERLVNVFRTPRPHSDLSILGRTRWDVLSIAASRSYVIRRMGAVAPFVEVSTQRPRAIVRPTVFEPAQFYGAERLWSFSAGARLGLGMRHSRMGRYGTATSHQMHSMKKADDHSNMDME